MTLHSIPLRLPAFDRVNLRTYRRRGVLRQFERAAGWLEPGERLAVGSVTETVRHGAILDIGIGGGRTATLMLEISPDYHGIDYCYDMVRVARERFPNLDFREMDARRMSFADDSFQLVTFSYNGIDSVDLGGRLDILHEVHRVLRPDGYFVFSALNREGAAYGERWPDVRVFDGAGYSLGRWLRGFGRLLLGGVNWVRFNLVNRTANDLAVGNISAHNFGLLTLFISVREQIRQLQFHGFQVEAIFEPDGTRIASDGSETTRAPWCHFVARKVVSGT